MIKIRIIAFTALCFSWLSVVLQQRNIKAASLRAQIVFSLAHRTLFYEKWSWSGLFHYLFHPFRFSENTGHIFPTKVFVVYCNHGAVNQCVLWNCTQVT